MGGEEGSGGEQSRTRGLERAEQACRCEKHRQEVPREDLKEDGAQTL